MLKYVKRSSLERANVNLRLVLILILYLILATTYSIVVPIGRGADEWAHYWYGQFIAQHGRLPANPVERELAGYKSDWPPLYHLFAAGVTSWVETDGPPTFKYRADNIRRQLVPALGPEAILHTEDELFPWQQEILVWHLGRFLSIVFTTGTLLVTYFIAMEIFTGSRGAGSRGAGSRLQVADDRSQVAGRRVAGDEVAGDEVAGDKAIRNTQHAARITQHAARDTHHATPFPPQTLALISVSILAFNPRFLFTGMLFNYDSLTLLLASLFLWLGIRIVKGYYPRWGFWGLGALAGLALVTKYLTALLPLEIVVLAFIRVAGSRVAGSRLQIAGSKVAGRGSQVAGDEVTGDEVAGDKATRNTQYAVRNTQYAARNTQHATPFIPLGQTALAFLLVTSWWFGYLMANFNEVDTYGPVLGTLSPLIRGDGSDRTVEQIFAFLSGGQAPPPAHIEKQSYTAWQIMAELPATFWGNPITRPYPLNWFIGAMTVLVLIAAVGIARLWRIDRSNRLWLNLLLFHCALPVPFMLIRLFGARDVLEAVQGRHILFLAGPAVAILLVWGLSVVAGGRVAGRRSQVAGRKVAGRRSQVAGRRVAGDKVAGDKAIRSTQHATRSTQHVSRFTFYVLLTLLLTGAIAQLIFMGRTYPPLLPVRTTPYGGQDSILSYPSVTLAGGARMIDYQLERTGSVLKVTVIWQGGEEPSPEDYQMELALVDGDGQARSGWLAYQTQARYPNRTWEAGDVIRDEGWLPLPGLASGDYEVRMRILGQKSPVVPWQTLTAYTLLGAEDGDHQVQWLLWHQGEVVSRPPLFRERETAQFGQSARQPGSEAANGEVVLTSSIHLIGPDGIARPPAAAGPTWANFIVEPAWSPGECRLQAEGEPVLRVAPTERNFQLPAGMAHPMEANFEGQIKLLGYDLPSRRVQPGEGLPLTLYWQGVQWMGEDFVIFNRLLDNPQDYSQQMAWGGYDRLAKENYSTLYWAPGEIVTDGFAVPVAPDAPAGVYTLALGWYRRVNGQAQSLFILNPETGEPTEATSVTIGPIKVGGPPPGITVAKVVPQTEVNVVLGAQLKLLGFDITAECAGPGVECGKLDTELNFRTENLKFKTQNLKLTVYWEALTQPETDYTVFVHVCNAAGEIVTQKDSPPVGGAYPTSLWDAGEIIKDEMGLSLDQLEPGQYELVVGMYDFTTSVRLPVEGSPDGTILLQSFEVGE